MNKKTALQAFKARCVPGARVCLYARWLPGDGELREVHALRSRDVAFLRPTDTVSYLLMPKASEIRQVGAAEFEITNTFECGTETLRYVFEDAAEAERKDA